MSFALFFAFPEQPYYTAPVAIMPKLYANSILIILNSRMRIVGGRETYTSITDMISIPRTELIFAGDGSRASQLVTIAREVRSEGGSHESVLVEMKGMSVCSLSYPWRKQR